MKNYEIVERDSGYWVIDETGDAQGPYDMIKDCHDDIPLSAGVQYPLGMMPRGCDHEIGG